MKLFGVRQDVVTPKVGNIKLEYSIVVLKVSEFVSAIAEHSLDSIWASVRVGQLVGGVIQATGHAVINRELRGSGGAPNRVRDGRALRVLCHVLCRKARAVSEGTCCVTCCIRSHVLSLTSTDAKEAGIHYEERELQATYLASAHRGVFML